MLGPGGGDVLHAVALEPDLARGQLTRGGRRERAARSRRVRAGLGEGLDLLRGRRAVAAHVVGEPGVLRGRDRPRGRRLVLAARMAEVGEVQRDRRGWVVRLQAVVVAQRLVGREEVIGPAAGDHQRGRGGRVVDPVGGVVGGDLVDYVGHLGIIVKAAGLEQQPLAPTREVGVRIGAVRCVEAREEAAEVERVDPALLRHADAVVGREVGGVGEVVEVAAVRDERVGEIDPGDLGSRGGQRERRTVGRLPVHVGAVGEHLAILERGQRHRRAAAVGAAGRPDPVAVDEALVDEESDQLLRVTDLVAGVHQADVAVIARRAERGARGRGAARLPEAARGHAEGRVALVEPAPHAAEAKLGAGVPVEQHHGGEIAVRPALGLGREGNVHVDGDAVERRQPCCAGPPGWPPRGYRGGFPRRPR